MPSNPWPAALPGAFAADTFEEAPQPITIRTDMDAGPPKVRRRFTNPVNTYRCSMILHDVSEYQVLQDFYYITLQGGTDTILMPHPITGVDALFRFVGPYRVKALGIAWEANFDLEELP